LYSCIFTRGDIDERHIFLVKDFMQPLAISILLRISSSLPPCASIWQPRYVKDSRELDGVAQNWYWCGTGRVRGGAYTYTTR